MIAARAVLDASVLIRASIDRTEVARGWVDAVERADVEGTAPDLVWLEVASALRKYIAAGSIEQPVASRALARLLALPLQTRALSGLAEPALARSLSLGLSVYDASYLVLAEASDSLLVTADERLAAAAARAELVV